MNEKPLDPFITTEYNGRWLGKVTADDRIAAVRSFTEAQCRAALEHTPGLQATVRRAIETRLRKLDRMG